MESRTLIRLARSLQLAVMKNDYSLVTSMLTENINNLKFVNRKIDDNGILRTSLDIASANGFIELVKLLITVAKADPDVKDSYGYSATFKAVKRGDLEVLKYLVDDGGSNVEATGPDGTTLLMTAIQSKPVNLRIILYIISKVQDIDSKNSKGYTSLFMATEKSLDYVIRALLFRGKANVNVKNGDDGWTSVMKASELGSLRLVKLLIEEGGADPNIKSDKSDKTVLHVAAQNQETPVVEYLITISKLDANQKEHNGLTPLYLAAEAGSVKIVKFLVEEAHVNINSKNGHNLDSIPLSIASQNGHDTTVEFLLSNGAQDHVDYVNLNKISPLYAAAEKGHTHIVQLLINVGNASTRIQNGDKEWTALHVATYKGHLEVVKILFQYSYANPFELTGDGKETALSLAEKNGQTSVVVYFRLMFNALVDLAERKGQEAAASLMRTMINTPPYSFEQIYPGQNASAVWAQMWAESEHQ